MFNSNPCNAISLVGYVARDPQIFANADGSKKVLMTVGVSRGYTAKDGSQPTDFIGVQDFVSAKAQTSPYANVHKGDLVAISASVRNNNYTAKDGTKVYGDIIVVTAIRKLRNGAASAEAAAEVPADGEDETIALDALLGE